MAAITMEDAIWKTLKGCALGCGVVAVLGLLAAGAGTWTVFRRYGRAVDARTALEELYGTQASYTPPRDGGIAADRMRRFLAVRRVLKPLCEICSRHQVAFQRMAAYSEMERPPMRQLIRDVGRAARSMPRIGSDFGNYILWRNEALLANEMGLGEYTWIYVITYYAWQGHRPARMIGGNSRPSVFHDRVFHEIRDVIGRHVADLEAALEPPATLGAWRHELEALDADAERIPFEEGLPPELVASLMPFQETVEKLACPATGELDVIRTEKDGFRYEHR